MADAGFNFSFSIWILDPTGQGYGAIVRVVADLVAERVVGRVVVDERAYAQNPTMSEIADSRSYRAAIQRVAVKSRPITRLGNDLNSNRPPYFIEYGSR